MTKTIQEEMSYVVDVYDNILSITDIISVVL